MEQRSHAYIPVLIAVTLLFLAGCGKKPEGADKVLVKVSNKTITLKDITDKIARLPAYYQTVISRNKKRFLEDTIVETMFYEEAIRQGIDRDKEVKEIVEEARRKVIITKLIKSEVEDKVKVDEKEVRQFYENHKDTFKRPALWRASHILVQSEAEARDLLDQLGKGASFEDLAKAKSIDATSTRGGDVGFFRKGQVVPEFEAACMNLSVGETSGIVKSQFGYHIIKLTDKKEPANETYDEVKRKIADEIKRQKQKELFDKLVLDLKNKYHVEIGDDAYKVLDSVEIKAAKEGDKEPEKKAGSDEV